MLDKGRDRQLPIRAREELPITSKWSRDDSEKFAWVTAEVRFE